MVDKIVIETSRANESSAKDFLDESDIETLFPTSQGRKESLWEDEWPINDRINALSQRNSFASHLMESDGVYDSTRSSSDTSSTYEPFPFSSPFSPPSSCPASPLSIVPLNSGTPPLNTYSTDYAFLLGTIDFGQLSESTDVSNEKKNLNHFKCTHEEYVKLLLELKAADEYSSLLYAENLELIAAATQTEIFHDIIINEYKKQIQQLMQLKGNDETASLALSADDKISYQNKNCLISPSPFSFSSLPIPSVVSISTPDLVEMKWHQYFNKQNVPYVDSSDINYNFHSDNDKSSSSTHSSTYYCGIDNMKEYCKQKNSFDNYNMRDIHTSHSINHSQILEDTLLNNSNIGKSMRNPIHDNGSKLNDYEMKTDNEKYNLFKNYMKTRGRIGNNDTGLEPSINDKDNKYYDIKLIINRIESVTLLDKFSSTEKKNKIEEGDINNINFPTNIKRDCIVDKKKDDLLDLYNTINSLMFEVTQYKDKLLKIEKEKIEIIANKKSERISAEKYQKRLRKLIFKLEGNLTLLNFETEEYKIQLLSQQKSIENISDLSAVEPSCVNDIGNAKFI